jgi:anti-sigma-K factor RskA
LEDIQSYIESGILELYVLGDITPQERLQVEEMAAKHPAIRTELNEIEQSMELYAVENAIEPAGHLREKIMNSLVTNLGDDQTFSAPIEVPTAKVVDLPARNTVNFYKYAFAACLALLLASVVALVSLYNKLQESGNVIAALQSNNRQFANTVSLKEGELQVLEDKSFKFVTLSATPHAPAQTQVTVAWSPANKKVWIDLRSLKMPVNDSTHQYQLWALVGGKPVDLGVFDKTTDSTDMKEMKSIASAQAFAVTLEPRGGSPAPTMNEMMVLGKF